MSKTVRTFRFFRAHEDEYLLVVPYTVVRLMARIRQLSGPLAA